jgi:hypothetical protein
MPDCKETGMLIWAFVFYFVIVATINTVSAIIMGFTIILFPLAFITVPVLGLYELAGLIFAFMSYGGYDFDKGEFIK